MPILLVTHQSKLLLSLLLTVIISQVKCVFLFPAGNTHYLIGLSAELYAFLGEQSKRQ